MAQYGILKTLLATERNGRDCIEYWQTDNGSIVHLEGRSARLNLIDMDYGPRPMIGREGVLVSEYSEGGIKPFFPYGKECSPFPSDLGEWHTEYLVERSAWQNNPPLIK